jgi:hypothetical protein
MSIGSCSKDDDKYVSEGKKEFVATAKPNAYALKFTDYFGDGNNIKRLDNDTNRIAILDALLTYKKIEALKPGDVLNIWENINVPPYIRVIDKVEPINKESNIIVYTHAGTMGDLFQRLSGGFDTSLYSNTTVRPAREASRADTPEADKEYVNDANDFTQFVDGDTIHPFMFYSLNEKTGEYDYDLAEKLYDDIVATAPNSRAASWEVNYNLLDCNVKNISVYPTKDADGKPSGFFVSDASAHVYANMEIFFEYNVFSSNRFWAYLKGGLDLNIPLHINLTDMTQKTYNKEAALYEFDPKFSVFNIGPFAIPVMIRHGFVFRTNAQFNAALSMRIPLYFKTSFTIGPKYDGKWHFVSDGNIKAGVDMKASDMYPAAVNLNVKAKMGVYYKLGAYLGAAFGPYFELGPQVGMQTNAEANGEGVILNTKGTIGLGGEVGAEIKVWKWNLGKIGIPYALYTYNLWNYDYRYSWGDLGLQPPSK